MRVGQGAATRKENVHRTAWRRDHLLYDDPTEEIIAPPVRGVSGIVEMVSGDAS